MKIAVHFMGLTGLAAARTRDSPANILVVNHPDQRDRYRVLPGDDLNLAGDSLTIDDHFFARLPASLTPGQAIVPISPCLAVTPNNSFTDPGAQGMLDAPF
jgi:hypothetical protein